MQCGFLITKKNEDKLRFYRKSNSLSFDLSKYEMIISAMQKRLNNETQIQHIVPAS